MTLKDYKPEKVVDWVYEKLSARQGTKMPKIITKNIYTKALYCLSTLNRLKQYAEIHKIDQKDLDEFRGIIRDNLSYLKELAQHE